MSIIKFTKMHGSGNDYIYINTMVYPILDPSGFSIKYSQFHTGIGSDGLVLIQKSEIADFGMRIFNADGSEAMMCGNATRCIGKYLYDNKLTTKKEVTLETLSGIKTLKLYAENDKVTKVTVDMGKPEVIKVIHPEYEVIEFIEKDITVNEYSFIATAISMGNPHLVIFVKDITKIKLDEIGPLIEKHSFFPDRTNVEFAEVISKEKIRMRVWERGSGITQACGTGACATAVAGILTHKCNKQVEIVMDGGTLEIEWTSENLFMTGDAVKVFEGEIEL